MSSFFCRGLVLVIGLLALLVGCGASVTSVGSIVEDDAGTAISPPAPTDDAAVTDATTTIDASAADVEAGDAHSTCAAGECGTKVCGRDECGHVCGSCAATPQGGCFTGSCTATCPGTPCVDHDGHQICEGERGGRSCAGGSLHIEVCTCSGGGANAWINCGACL